MIYALYFSMCGPNTDAEWMIEGRRLIPLMPRLVPQTAFTVTANQMANLQAEKNAAMPSPSRTGSRDGILYSLHVPIRLFRFIEICIVF